MKDLLMKQDVIRKEGEEFAEYYPRFRFTPRLWKQR